MTRSMHTAVADLKLDALYVVYPGPQRYRQDRRVEVVPLGELARISCDSDHRAPGRIGKPGMSRA